jgi:hypothetical protein
MTVVLYPPYLAPCNFSLFPRLKIKLKNRHFDTLQIIEAESQAVLKTRTGCILKMAEMLETVHTRGRGLRRG